MEALRGRCTSPRGDNETLPITFRSSQQPKAWRSHGSAKHRHGGGRHAGGLRARFTLLRSMVAALAIVVAVRLAAHMFQQPEPQLEDLMRLYSDGLGGAGAAGERHAAGAAAEQQQQQQQQQPKLIPRILHQTHAGGAVPTPLLPFLASWRRLNPGWEVRLYDDQDCLEFVRREFPQYLDAYRRLARGVERADFFRYMAVLRHGGVYADLDAECRRPLDGVLHSRDTLVAGWAAEFADPRAALDAGYVRQRQLVQWVFAGAPGHPALKDLCDRIAAGVSQQLSYSSDARLNTLERTGAGLFTDVLLRHAAAHPPARHEDPWGVRLLPRAVFGAPPTPAFGLSPADPGVAVLHHSAGGAWGRSGGGAAAAWPWLVQDAASEVARRWRHRSEDAWEEQAKVMAERDAAQALYPVSAAFEPPFDVLTHRVGRGERQSGADVGAALTAHGSWQPSVQPSRRPSLVDAVVGSLGGADGGRNVLVDVGAGYGLLSLAAAARGHRVHAFELGPASLEALEASLAHNGFQHLVTVHKEPLGSLEQSGYTCILPRAAAGAAAAAVDLEVQRGYGDAAVHAMPAESCQLMTRRSAGAWAVPETDRVAALRVSANGWEGFVLQGFAPLLERDDRPPVLAVEWDPAAMRAAGWHRPLKLLEWLYGLGYNDISHSGYACDERWYSITYGIRRRGGITPEDLASLRQPTWCRLTPQHFSLLLDHRASQGASYPETLLFVSRAAGAANATASASGKGAAGAGPHGEHAGSSSSGVRTDEFGVPDAVAQALAEAALMVADHQANQTARAVSDLAAAAGNSASRARTGTLPAAQKQPAQQQQQQQQQQQLLQQQQPLPHGRGPGGEHKQQQQQQQSNQGSGQ